MIRSSGRAGLYEMAADAIVGICAEELDVTYDDTTSDMIRDRVVAQLTSPADHFEVIVDKYAASANWRLKANVHGAGVRLADYQMTPSTRRADIEDRVNTRIRTVLVGANIIGSATKVGRR